MIQLSEDNTQQIAEIVNASKPAFVLIGEMHGSKQNAPLMQRIISLLATEALPVTIAFEWAISDQELEGLQAYIVGGPILAPTSFFLDSDGRFTLEHARLLKWIREQNLTGKRNTNITLYTFDKKGIDAKDVERKLADSLIDYKKRNAKTLLLVETGSIHARKAPYSLNGETCIPMGALLKENHAVFSIFIRYLAGEVNVEGVPRDIALSWSQQQDPSPFFDAALILETSEPSEEIRDWTNITALL